MRLRTRPNRPVSRAKALVQKQEQESAESGLISPEKAKILEQHRSEHPQGDPAVRRIHPSRDVIGRTYHRRAEVRFIDVLHNRHGIYHFTATPIDQTTLESLFELIQVAPSAGNLQSFRIIAVENKGTQEQLAQAARGQQVLAAAPVVLVFCADQKHSASRYGERGKNLYAIQDATIAATYALLGATALGLGSAWIGEFDAQQVSKILEIKDPDLVPVAMLPIGYPAEAPEASPRRAINEWVSYKK